MKSITHITFLTLLSVILTTTIVHSQAYLLDKSCSKSGW